MTNALSPAAVQNEIGSRETKDVRLGSPIPFRQTQSTFFIRTHNEPLSIIAMCVSNPDRSPVRIDH
jgi:hypothetical protein